MSHEIRTPLNGVIGVIDALARTPLSPQQAEMVELVRSSGVTLERLVTDILDVSRIESGRMTLEVRPFDLDDALIPTIAPLRGLAEEKGLIFRIERAESACGVFNGDVVRIRQILGNLLSNAVKFTAQGQVSAHIDLLDRGDGAALLTLEVRDTGIGFGADHAAQLFQRFSQADASITRRFGGAGHPRPRTVRDGRRRRGGVTPIAFPRPPPRPAGRGSPDQPAGGAADPGRQRRADRGRERGAGGSRLRR